MKRIYTLLILLLIPACVSIVYFDILKITPKTINFFIIQMAKL